MDVLRAYWDKIGGKPQAKPKTPAKKGTKRKSITQDTPEVAATSTTKKRGRKSTKTVDADIAEDNKMSSLPEGSWEEHVQLIDAVEKPDEGEHKGVLMIYLLWENGSRTQHTAQQCRQKCPQKVAISTLKHKPQMLTYNSFSTTTSPSCTAIPPNPPIAEDVPLTRPRVFKTNTDADE